VALSYNTNNHLNKCFVFNWQRECKNGNEKKSSSEVNNNKDNSKIQLNDGPQNATVKNAKKFEAFKKAVYNDDPIPGITIVDTDDEDDGNIQLPENFHYTQLACFQDTLNTASLSLSRLNINNNNDDQNESQNSSIDDIKSKKKKTKKKNQTEKDTEIRVERTKSSASSIFPKTNSRNNNMKILNNIHTDLDSMMPPTFETVKKLKFDDVVKVILMNSYQDLCFSMVKTGYCDKPGKCPSKTHHFPSTALMRETLKDHGWKDTNNAFWLMMKSPRLFTRYIELFRERYAEIDPSDTESDDSKDRNFRIH
jgi:Flp pilus assembly protein TadG